MLGICHNCGVEHQAKYCCGCLDRHPDRMVDLCEACFRAYGVCWSCELDVVWKVAAP